MHRCLFVLFPFAHVIFVFVNFHYIEPGMALKTVTDGEATHFHEASSEGGWFVSFKGVPLWRSWLLSMLPLLSIFLDALKISSSQTTRIKYISCFVVSSCCWHKSVTLLYHPSDLRISIFKILSTLQKNHTHSRNCDNYNYTKMIITFTEDSLVPSTVLSSICSFSHLSLTKTQWGRNC